jgi:hypothetical protein
MTVCSVNFVNLEKVAEMLVGYRSDFGRILVRCGSDVGQISE